jgi:hypothetical protein
MPRHTFDPSPKLGIVKVFRLTWHAKTKGQVMGLTLRKRLKALRQA